MTSTQSSSVWEQLAALGQSGTSITPEEVTQVIKLIPTAFRLHLIQNGVSERQARALTTKLRDAGRRSAPWKPTSSKVPGRPQDGEDGNRINRWLLPTNHKFYADERTATLVEIKYFLQMLSMDGAPPVPSEKFNKAWHWLLGHDVAPGEYLDPVWLTGVALADVCENPRIITSGHIVPLDRGGRHEPDNTFLILKKSNDLQGNNTIPELLLAIDGIASRHKKNGTFPI